MGNLQLTSSAFSHGEEIPRECGYKNGNEVPHLEVISWPDGTKSLTIIMDDPDAKAAVGKVWVHWVVWNIHPWEQVGSGDFSEDLICTHAIEGTTDFGEVGYGGPAPPDKRHTYVFKFYALDCELDLPESVSFSSLCTKADVEKAMEGHIIEQTQLTGTYAP